MEQSQLLQIRTQILDLELAKLENEPDTPEVRMMRTLLRERRVWVDVPRMRNLFRLSALYRDTTAAFVECGVAMGGSLAIMAAHSGDRFVWGFDSFEGLPDLSAEDEGDGEGLVGVRCSGNEGEGAVAHTFELVGVSMACVRLVKGWFEDTLPSVLDEIGPIAILRLDADWYEATRYALNQLYDLVIPGGAVVIDDYFWCIGCRRAVDEFRAEREIASELVVTDERTEVYWLA